MRIANTFAVATLLASVAAPCAAQPPGELARLLGEQRPDVQRWQIRAADARRQPGEGVALLDVGRVSARLAARFADGRVYWYDVAGFRAVNVTRQAVNAGEPLLPSATGFAERDVIALACLPVEVSAASRWRATRRLAAGDALCEHNLQRVPDVARDSAVTLSAQRLGVIVSREFKADADAQAGERVRLRDPASGATLIAIVTGPAAARIPE